MATPDSVGHAVRSFYETQPFNISSPDMAAKRIRAADQTRTYVDLSAHLDKNPNASICDIGCGGGWFTASIAFHRRRAVIGLDFSRSALTSAWNTTSALAVLRWAQFVQGDILCLPFGHDQQFDVVNSLGVLHHTWSTKAALRIVAELVAPGGVIHVGLYHQHGRGPFLALFDEWRDQGGKVPLGHQEEAFRRYRSLNRGIGDIDLLRSWFVDQVLHPVERSHTLLETTLVMESMGFKLRSSSLSRFESVSSDTEMDRLDQSQSSLSWRRNVDQGRYFPGFFTALYDRKC